jgi:hypothetical protein
MTGRYSGDAVARDKARKIPVDARVFGLTGLFLGAVGVLYAVLASEDTGVVMLLVTSLFCLVVFGYLLARDKGRTADLADDAPHDVRHEPYFPQSSIWPLTVGGGTVLSLAGLALGLWVLLPGVALLIRGGVGWAAQSKARS